MTRNVCVRSWIEIISLPAFKKLKNEHGMASNSKPIPMYCKLLYDNSLDLFNDIGSAELGFLN